MPIVDSPVLVQGFAARLVETAIQSALRHMPAPHPQFCPERLIADKLNNLVLETMEGTAAAAANLKSCVHKEQFKDGRKRSVTFDPKFVKDNLEQQQQQQEITNENHKDSAEPNPRQRKVSQVPTVLPQPEEYSGDEEVTHL